MVLSWQSSVNAQQKKGHKLKEQAKEREQGDGKKEEQGKAAYPAVLAALPPPKFAAAPAVVAADPTGWVSAGVAAASARAAVHC